MSPDEYKIHVQKDGKNLLASKEWLKQYLGICGIEGRLHELEQPMRMQKILDVLKAEGKARSSNWLSRWMADLEWSDLIALEREGKVSSFYSGSHKMWKVAT